MWFQSSLNFYDKIKVVKNGPSNNFLIPPNSLNNINKSNDKIPEKLSIIDKTNNNDEETEKQFKTKNDLRKKYSEILTSKKLNNETTQGNKIDNILIENELNNSHMNNKEAMIFDTDESGDIVFNYKAALKSKVIKEKDINKIFK